MNTHFQDQLISRWMSGQATDTDREHVSRCSDCRVELERCETTLTGFGKVVRQWSEYELAAPRQPKRDGRLVTSHLLQACIALVLIVWGMESLQRRWVGQPAPHAVPVADGDDLLLDEISADVARQVPAGMEPLLPLFPEADQDAEQRTP